MVYAFFYRALMRLAHRYNWHHMVICYPDGDTLVWCQWCGIRHIIKRSILGVPIIVNPKMEPGQWRLEKRKENL